jgi:predicted phosphoribosyltransferase
MFRNREEAARLLARRFIGRELVNPLVLAIPRGGVATGAVLARELGAELDVVLSRKLRAPYQPELAVGAVAEDGRIYFNPRAEEVLHLDEHYIARERAHQLDEIARRKALVRAVRPQATIEGRSVIVTDDGIATGATMIAALDVARARRPFELIVAVPVASPDRLREVRRHCDEVICLLAPTSFYAIGQFYADFRPVQDEQVVELLRGAEAARPAAESSEIPCVLG